MNTSRKFYRLNLIAIACISLILQGQIGYGSDPIQLYPGGNSADGFSVNQTTQVVVYDMTFNYFAGNSLYCLSSQSYNCAPLAIDDAVRIYVDNIEVFCAESFTKDFGPVDFTNMLPEGNHTIRVQVIDLLGPSAGGGSIWINPRGGEGDCWPDCGQNASQAPQCSFPKELSEASTPTEESTITSPSVEQAQNFTEESWYTSINECEVNPQLYEFYKDQNGQLKLVVAHASGIIDIINNFFQWIGFLIDSSKVKFEPTADEVKVSLLYSSEGHFQIQVDRYVEGQLLSTDTEQIDQSTYDNYLKNLGACGINA